MVPVCVGSFWSRPPLEFMHPNSSRLKLSDIIMNSIGATEPKSAPPAAAALTVVSSRAPARRPLVESLCPESARPGAARRRPKRHQPGGLVVFRHQSSLLAPRSQVLPTASSPKVPFGASSPSRWHIKLAHMRCTIALPRLTTTINHLHETQSWLARPFGRNANN